MDKKTVTLVVTKYGSLYRITTETRFPSVGSFCIDDKKRRKDRDHFDGVDIWTVLSLYFDNKVNEVRSHNTIHFDKTQRNSKYKKIKLN